MTKRDEQAAEYAAEQHTDHDAAPAAIAVSDEDRPDKPTTSHRDDGTGDTRTLTDAEREAVAWCAEQWSGLKIAATLRALLARLGGDA